MYDSAAVSAVESVLSGSSAVSTVGAASEGPIGSGMAYVMSAQGRRLRNANPGCEGARWLCVYDFVAVSAVESVLASGKLSTASPPFVAPSCISTAT